MSLEDQGKLLKNLFGTLDKTQEVQKRLEGTTGRSGTNNHRHDAHVNGAGNGKTSFDEGHRHEIVNFKVREAQDHIHSLTRGELKKR